ncbi:MAG TPA: spore coat U domain-containing protein [Dokdonella sp.]
MRTPILSVAATAALAAGLVASAPARAATATSQFRVTLTLQAECKLTSASDLAFGTDGVIDATITATSTIGVQCTNTTPYNIGLNAGTGAGATVTTRKMTAGTGATVNYQLFRDSARTQVWGDTVNSNTQAGTGTGVVQSYTVYGSVPVQTTPAAGAYSDTVQVTVTY